MYMYALNEHRVSTYFLLSLVSSMDVVRPETHTGTTVRTHLGESL